MVTLYYFFYYYYYQLPLNMEIVLCTLTLIALQLQDLPLIRKYYSKVTYVCDEVDQLPMHQFRMKVQYNMKLDHVYPMMMLENN